MGRHQPGSTPVSPRVLLGVAGLLGLLFGLPARAEEAYVGNYRVVNAPPNTQITVTLDATQATSSVVTDDKGHALFELKNLHWAPGTGQITYIDPRPRARVNKWIEFDDGNGVVNLGWNEMTPRQRAEVAFRKSIHYSLGVGWGREIHEDSPSGGGFILQGRADYPLCDRWHAGVGAGYYWLGSTTTTWQGQTGQVRLSANPIWGELVYDLKERGYVGQVFRDDWGNSGGYESVRTHGVVPWVAVGGGPYWRRVRGDFEAENNTAVDFGMNVAVGLDDITREKRAQIGLEARYHNVIREHLEGFQLVTLNLNVRF